MNKNQNIDTQTTSPVAEAERKLEGLQEEKRTLTDKNVPLLGHFVVDHEIKTVEEKIKDLKSAQD